MRHLSLALTKAAVQFGVEFPQIRMAAYLDAVRGHDEAVLVAAVERCCRTLRFFPSVAEILTEAGASRELEAAGAWREAVRIASKGRAVDRDADASPAVRAAVAVVGGWDAIGLTPTAKLHFVERRFCEIYTASTARVDAALVACEASKERRALEGTA